MKKLIIVVASLLLLFGVSACNSCSAPKATEVAPADSVEVVDSVVVPPVDTLVVE